MIFVALAVGKAVLLWNYDYYDLPTAPSAAYPETEGVRIELKCVREGGKSSKQRTRKCGKRKRMCWQSLSSWPGTNWTRDRRASPSSRSSPSWVLLWERFFGRIGFGALAGFVLGRGVGFIRFGPKQGVPMVYIVDTRILQWLVDSRIWCLVCDSKGRRVELQ